MQGLRDATPSRASAKWLASARLLSLVMFMAAACLSFKLQAEPLKIAVAANFAAPIKELVQAYRQQTGQEVLVSLGSTGKFHAQIQHGAPYDVLLAADESVPRKLIAEGLAEPGSLFTYAIGTLVLWSPAKDYVKGPDVLRSNHYRKLAVADPKLAPYGMAAYQVLKNLGDLDVIASRIVTGESIVQAYQFVASGNAQLGFVAMSQVFENGELKSGSAWVVPENLYQPIRQDAVTLKKSQDRHEAIRWMQFLQSDAARAIIQRFGYRTP